MVDDEERRGPMAFKKPELVKGPLEREKIPVRSEQITGQRIPVKVAARKTEGVGQKMAETMADPLYKMLEAARKKGIVLELHAMVGMV